MTKKFHSAKSFSVGIMLLSLSLLMIILALVLPWYKGNIHTFSELATLILFSLIIPVYSLWMWFGTNYVIADKLLIARSGPMLFKVPINQIKVIRLNQNAFGKLWKLSTSWRTMLIEYNKTESIFISPVGQDEFIADLMKINPDIEIK